MKKFFTSSFKSLILNTFLFLFLLIGIQNHQQKEKIYFLNYESINMPISFIVGISFITGSIYSDMFKILFKINK